MCTFFERGGARRYPKSNSRHRLPTFNDGESVSMFKRGNQELGIIIRLFGIFRMRLIRMEQPIEARGGGQDTSWVVVSSDWSVCEEIDGPASRLGLGLFGSRAGDVVSLTSGSNVVKARTRAVSS